MGNQEEAAIKGAESVLSVVVVSADRSLVETTKRSLEDGNGEAEISVATDVDEAITQLQKGPPRLVIADYEITNSRLGEILEQAESSQGVPVIVVVSNHNEIPRCLQLGATDFISKPVSTAELAGRAAIHSAEGSRRTGIKFLGDGLAIDTSARLVLVENETAFLTAREYELFEYLSSSPGVTCTREELLARVWGSSSKWQDPATVTEHIHRLRRKLERDPSRPRWIVTVRGEGYRFQA